MANIRLRDRILVGALTMLLVGPATAASRSDEDSPNPARLSLLEGSVSFWRTGADDWVKARLNTPLAPGDHVYAGDGGRLEVQFGPEAFIRAGEETDLVLEALERDYIRFRVARGVASIDIRSIDPDLEVELGAAGAAMTIREPGYYRADVGEEETIFVARRGGEGQIVTEDGERWRLRSEQQVMVDPRGTPTIRTYQAPREDDWDQWNDERSEALVRAQSSRELPRGVYGGESLDRYGRWDDEPTYGRVWYPESVPDAWAPYTDGEWVLDPVYGWTWIDYAPWGWAPFHYGRWVHVGPRWGWVPGPVRVRPFYAPAVVGFLAGPRVSVGISIGAPIGWVALGWGEPIIPWWGRRGFIGNPCWHGWGGPRIVNQVEVHVHQHVHVDRVVYANTSVHGAFVSVSRDHFGHGGVGRYRESGEAHSFRPVRGRVPVEARSRSLVPMGSDNDGHSARPSRRDLERATVATRRVSDPTARLKSTGLRPTRADGDSPRVIVPRRVSSRVSESSRAVPAPVESESRDHFGRSANRGNQRPRHDRPDARSNGEQPPTHDGAPRDARERSGDFRSGDSQDSPQGGPDRLRDRRARPERAIHSEARDPSVPVNRQAPEQSSDSPPPLRGGRHDARQQSAGEMVPPPYPGGLEERNGRDRLDSSRHRQEPDSAERRTRPQDRPDSSHRESIPPPPPARPDGMEREPRHDVPRSMEPPIREPREERGLPRERMRPQQDERPTSRQHWEEPAPRPATQPQPRYEEPVRHVPAEPRPNPRAEHDSGFSPPMERNSGLQESPHGRGGGFDRGSPMDRVHHEPAPVERQMPAPRMERFEPPAHVERAPAQAPPPAPRAEPMERPAPHGGGNSHENRPHH